MPRTSSYVLSLALALIHPLLFACSGASSHSTVTGPAVAVSSAAAAGDAPWVTPDHHTYRYVGWDPYDVEVDAEGTFATRVEEARAIVSRDGTAHVAVRDWVDLPPDGLRSGHAVLPARMGGGYLFWSLRAVYRASTPLGPLESIAPLPTSAFVSPTPIAFAFGPDSLLVMGPSNYRRRYDLRGTRLPLSPRAVVNLAASDSGRAVAIDAAGRALASKDRGATWQDVTSLVQGCIVHLHGDADDAWFELSDGQGAWVTSDGKISMGPARPTGRKVRPRYEEVRARYALLERAVAAGVWVGRGRVLFADGDEVALMDVDTGVLIGSPRKLPLAAMAGVAMSTTEGAAMAARAAPPAVDTGPPRYARPKHAGAAPSKAGRCRYPVPQIHTPPKADDPPREPPAGCEVLSAEPEPLSACFGPSQVAILSLSKDVSSARVEKRFPAATRVAYAKGTLVAAASCDGKALSGVACTRRADGVWTEHDLRRSAGIVDSSVARPPVVSPVVWIPREDGGVGLLLAGQHEDGHPSNWSLLGGTAGARVPLDAELPPLVRARDRDDDTPSRFPPRHVETNWIMLRNGQVRGYAARESLAVSAEGHVKVEPLAFQDLVTREGYAFGCKEQGRYYQSVDWGATWTQVARAPGIRPRCRTGLFDDWSHECSSAGCYLGPWIRTGWPSDPPPSEAIAAAKPITIPVEKPEPRPILECTERGRPAAIRKPVEEDSSQEDDGQAPTKPMVFRANDGFGSSGELFNPQRVRIDYEVPGDERVRRTPASLSAPIVARFLEPFDPSVRERTARTTFQQWLGASPSKAEPPRYSEPRSASDTARALPGRHGGSDAAYPLFSSRPGRSSGVLIADQPAIWLTTSGDMRRLTRLDPHCRLTGGYVDTSGKLWVACASSEGDTQIIDATTGAAALTLGTVFPPPPWPRRMWPDDAFSWNLSGFRNPDVLAVGPDGKLAVLRLPSGSEPATVDNPALILTSGSAEPMQLSPWSTIEFATSAVCRDAKGGFRAIIETPDAWLRAAVVTMGATDSAARSERLPNADNAADSEGMYALVRWSAERLCLEGVEAPVAVAAPGGEASEPGQRKRGQTRLVGRFVGEGSGAALVDEQAHSLRTATCRLVSAQESNPQF